MKKVLLTGAGGFIGRHAIEELLARGFEVHAVTGRSFRLPRIAAAKVAVHECDLLDPLQQKELLDKVAPSHLLHFAWYTAHGKFWTSLDNLPWVAASLGLLQNFIRNGGKRVVFAGTCAEYDWSEGHLSEETTPLRPKTLYGECKNSLRAIFFRTAEQVGLSAAWGRVFFLYGPFEAPGRLVPSAIIPLLRGETAHFSHGRQIRDFMHVEDVARAFVALLDSDYRGAMNIASGEPFALRDVIELTSSLLERPDLVRFGTLPAGPGDPAKLTADVTRLRDALHFVPKYTLEGGLRMTIRWWKESGVGERPLPAEAPAEIGLPFRVPATELPKSV